MHIAEPSGKNLYANCHIRNYLFSSEKRDNALTRYDTKSTKTKSYRACIDGYRQGICCCFKFGAGLVAIAIGVRIEES